jgi:hypothetical protein
MGRLNWTVTNFPQTQYTFLLLHVGLCSRQIRGWQRKKILILIFGTVRAKRIPSTKEIGKHVLRFTFMTSALRSHLSFPMENTECKIQNHLTSEARIFCLPYCRKQGVAEAKHCVYGGPGQESRITWPLSVFVTSRCDICREDEGAAAWPG